MSGIDLYNPAYGAIDYSPAEKLRGPISRAFPEIGITNDTDLGLPMVDLLISHMLNPSADYYIELSDREINNYVDLDVSTLSANINRVLGRLGIGKGKDRCEIPKDPNGFYSQQILAGVFGGINFPYFMYGITKNNESWNLTSRDLSSYVVDVRKINPLIRLRHSQENRDSAMDSLRYLKYGELQKLGIELNDNQIMFLLDFANRYMVVSNLILQTQDSENADICNNEIATTQALLQEMLDLFNDRY